MCPNQNFFKQHSCHLKKNRRLLFFSPFLVIIVVNLRSCWTRFLLVGFFVCLAFCGYSMVLTTFGLGLGWVSPCWSSCTVTTMSNLEMRNTVIVPTITLHHSGVGAVVPLLSLSYLAVICLVLVFSYPILA